MWFRREKKNRRLSRGHVLDVKLRSGQVRATRTRLAAIAFGVLFGTVFGLYLFWCAGEWALDHFVYENPEFAIRHIDVQTDGVILPDQLRRWAGRLHASRRSARTGCQFLATIPHPHGGYTLTGVLRHTKRIFSLTGSS